MSTPTTNFGLLKGDDSDDAENYLHVSLATSLDIIDNMLRAVTGGFTVASGGLAVSTGTVGIGTVPLSYVGEYLVPVLVSASTSQYGLLSTPVCSSSATNELDAIFAVPQTPAVAMTCSAVIGLHCGTAIKGAGSTITSSYGIVVEVQNTGTTNNYGILIQAPSGGASANIGLLNNGAAVVNGSSTALGFFGGAGTTRQTITGSRGSNAALASLLTALAAYGLLTDSSS